MAKRIAIATERDYIKLWQTFRDNFCKATPIDLSESKADKLKRIADLERNHEDWFRYYFPNYYTSEPAQFHIRATKRILSKPEWFEVRAWSRELAKTSRAMMEIAYLTMTSKIHNVLLASNSSENAELLLMPVRACFETNQRIIHDYGIQEKIGDWKARKFTIRKGCTFRALGWGESPRGTKNENYRPDFIWIDDFDTDEECRNEDVMKNKISWVEQALIPTRSISRPTRILMNGNIIHDNCAVKYFGENTADCFDVVNIRDAEGKSTWPQKNSEDAINRVLSTISYESAQKEYFNNPMDGSDTFKDLRDGKVPRLGGCNVCIYADPATSNRDVTRGSMKAIGLLAQKGFDLYVVRVKLDTMSNAKFVDALFDIYKYAIACGAENVRVWLENNTLQNPFYEQVLLPLIYRQANETKIFLPITPDLRVKKDKYTRIEGTLEPVNRLGHLIFNIAEAESSDMKRLKAQFKNFSRKQKRMDGPDMVEGGVFKLKEMEAVNSVGSIEFIKRTNNKRM